MAASLKPGNTGKDANKDQNKGKKQTTSISRNVAFWISLFIVVLYIITSAQLLLISLCTGSAEACSGSLNEGLLNGHNTIQGAVTGVVVAILAITPPNEALKITKNPSQSEKAAIAAYVGLWALIGALSLVIGSWSNNPNVVPAVAEYGENWLGLAISAVAIYFGIDPGQLNKQT